MIKKKADTKWEEFKAKKHKIGTYEVSKISLSRFDDKRFVLDDGIHALAYFHEDCKKQKDVPKDSHRWSEIRTDSCKKDKILTDDHE